MLLMSMFTEAGIDPHTYKQKGAITGTQTQAQTHTHTHTHTHLILFHTSKPTNIWLCFYWERLQSVFIHGMGVYGTET